MGRLGRGPEDHGQALTITANAMSTGDHDRNDARRSPHLPLSVVAGVIRDAVTGKAVGHAGAAGLERARRSRLLQGSRSGAAPRRALGLTFDELVLIYKSLETVKTLAALPSQDELLEDTIQLVDTALNAFAR